MSRDLDMIGKINFNYFSSYLSTEKLLPQMPSFEMPSFEMKNFSQEFTKYVAKYKSYYQKEHGEEEVTDVNIIDSFKTAISSRIQMTKFLNDLKLGVNISTAIDRLQPLTDVINETIFLPADDFIDFEETTNFAEAEGVEEEVTEPVGIGEIVNKSQPLINEIVKPGASSTRRRASRRRGKGKYVYVNDSVTSQTSDVDGLTIEEVTELTELKSLDDFAKQDVLRTKIKKIQNLTIDQGSKNKLVTKLMMGNYYKYINEKLSEDDKHLLQPLRKQKLVIEEPEPLGVVNEQGIDGQDDEEGMDEESDGDESDDDDGEEVILTEKDLQPSYNDQSRNILGCSHYQTNCKIECPTCYKWYPCRFCHDSETTTHKLIRNEVNHILCMHCNTPQVPDSNYCINCDQELANYFCSKCVLYDNDQTKDIYHCDKCGICRLGLGLDKDYFHCDTCNTCLSIDLKGHHKCLSDVTHSDCCICHEDLFSSVHKVVFMKCGHSIHEQCYAKFTKFSSKCPICKKTITNVESQYRILDVEIAQSPLPSPYNLWRCIISCNDCGGKSNTSYHVLGLKCKYCNSYNTNQLKLIKPEEDDDEEYVEEKRSVTNFDANVIRLVKTNLQNNFGIDERQVDAGDEENSGYEDDMEVEDDEDEMGNFINFKKITDNGSNNVSYITTMFQNFVNNATKLTIKENNNSNNNDDDDDNDEVFD
ncbi:SPAC2F3.16 Uncharacterized RING finger protein C2F3.16 [Candida maltosa Xu316]